MLLQQDWGLTAPSKMTSGAYIVYSLLGARTSPSTILVWLEAVAGDEFGGDLGLVHGCLNRKIVRGRKGLLWRISALSRALRGGPCGIGVCTSFPDRI